MRQLDEQNRILHELLTMGEMLLTCGAEINRVEDTMTRLGRAYGAERVDIFVITSDIVLTILFSDGTELTQTRRISRNPAVDFRKLESLNALSRRCCAAPLSAAEFHAALEEIDQKVRNIYVLYIGSVITAGGFAVFLGGSWADGLAAALIGVLVCFLQQKIAPVFRNAAFFQLLTGLLAGAAICLLCRILPQLAVDKLSIGVIMLLIPGAALTNAVRDMLVGHTISGLLRLAESLLLALMLAIGFGSAIYLIGV